MAGREKKDALNISGWFDNKIFIAALSFAMALILWFAMSIQNTTDRVRVIWEVPIEINLSESAVEAGIKIFDQSYTTADVSITGSSAIANRVTAEDIVITASYSPVSTKIAGNNLFTEVVTLKASKKNNSRSDFEIVGIEPKELTIQVDRLRETTFQIDNTNINYTVETGYYAGTPVFSEERVSVSGPESAVNKISRISADYEIPTPVRQDQIVSSALTAYDQSNRPINLAEQYIKLTPETIQVTIPVLNRKTVRLTPTIINAPSGFSNSRITVEPETIDIAGSSEALGEITEILLSEPIDFSLLDMSGLKYEMPIEMPAGVTSISNEKTAIVKINLNAYKEIVVNTTNLTLTNIPAGKTATLATRSLDVRVIVPDAQATKLTGESVYCTVDMTNYAQRNGNVDVPVNVSVSGINTSWVVGRYTVNVKIQDQVAFPEEREGDSG